MSSEFHELVETSFRAIALRAGAVIMDVYAQPDFDTRSKADDSPVTEADEAADRLIRAELAQVLPDIPVVTEELTESHSVKADRFIIVDPLDGTKEFVKRRGDFTVNIALVEKGVPVRGVVYAPAKGRLFYTSADGSSVEETGPFGDTPGALTKITVSKPDNAALKIVASKSHRDAETEAYIGRYSMAENKAAGSSLKFCLIATGEADFYPRLGRTMEWDTAAGHAVVLGAGGKVLRFDDHSPLTYGKPGYENPFFLVLAQGVTLK